MKDETTVDAAEYSEAVLVLAESSYGIRHYPKRVTLNGRLLPVVYRIDAVREIVAAFVDIRSLTVIEELTSRNVPMVLSVESALDLSAIGASPYPLHVLLPGYASDVTAAYRAIEEGCVGDPVFVEVSVYIGDTLSDPRWEPDNLCAFSNVEALAYGLQLSRLLVGPGQLTTDVENVYVRRGRGLHVASWSFKIGSVAIVQHIFAGSVASAPLFSAMVVGETGRLNIRQELSPGAITIWSSSQRELRCPSISRRKGNVQAPDTWPGGEEFHVALESAVVWKQDQSGQSYDALITPLVLHDTERFLDIWEDVED